jgi:general secretion pathway protein K
MPKERTSRSRGIALVCVLWIVALLGMVALGVSSGVRSETRMVRNMLSATQAQYAAEGAIDLAVLQLVAPGPDIWPTDGTVRNIRIANASVSVAIYDEAGKIDLNFASADVLNNVLTAAGVEAEHRMALVDAILDWRDTDDLRHLNGAEDDDYSTAGLPYGAKDDKFDTVSELGLVLGMQPDILQAIQPVLTVFSRRPGIDPSVASADALRAFAGDDVDGVDAYIEQRKAFSGAVATPEIGFLNGRQVTASGKVVFTIHTEARIDQTIVARVAATVAVTGGSETYKVLNWQQAPNFVIMSNSEMDPHTVDHLENRGSDE